MNTILLLLLFEIALLLLSYISTDNDILSPSTVFSGMFVISTFVAILNVNNWNIHYRFDSLYILTIGIICFVFTEIIIKNCFSSKTIADQSSVIEEINVPKYYILFFFLIDCIVIVWYYFEIKRLVAAYGYYQGNLLHSFRVISTNTSFSGLSINLWLNQLLKLVKGESFALAFIAVNNLFSNNRKPNNLLYFTIVVSLIPSIMSGGRGGILQFIVGLAIYVYILWQHSHKWSINISWNKLIRIILFIIAFILVFYFSTNWIGRNNTYSLFEYISSYIGGSIQWFNLYIDDPVGKPSVFGEESLIALLSFLHKHGLDIPVRSSYHLEARLLGDNIYGNIYTFFRRPYHDFGLIGMCVFTVVISSFFSFLYYGFIKKKSFNQNAILVYGYLFYWVVYSSIEQWSQTIVSTTELLTIIFMLLLSFVIKKVRIKI